MPVVLLAWAGCSGSDPNLPPLLPASGAVTLGGKPLSGAQVRFVPAGYTGGSGASGYTDEAGRYDLASGHGRGAAAGQYRVTIEKLVMPDGTNFPADSDVPEGGSDKLDFALKP